MVSALNTQRQHLREFGADTSGSLKELRARLSQVHQEYRALWTAIQNAGTSQDARTSGPAAVDSVVALYEALEATLKAASFPRMRALAPGRCRVYSTNGVLQRRLLCWAWSRSRSADGQQSGFSQLPLAIVQHAAGFLSPIVDEYHAVLFTRPNEHHVQGKYYVIQLLETDEAPARYFLSCRWNACLRHDGTSGQLDGPFTLEEGVTAFHKRFREKTRPRPNQHYELTPFRSVPDMVGIDPYGPTCAPPAVWTIFA